MRRKTGYTQVRDYSDRDSDGDGADGLPQFDGAANPVHRSSDNWDHKEEDDCCKDCCTRLMLAISWILFIFLMPFSLFFSWKTVREYERAVVLRMGRMRARSQGPGLLFLLRCVDKLTVVDVRTRSLNVPPQTVISNDGVSVVVDAVIYYSIRDATKSVLCVADPHHCTNRLSQTMLRNVLGTKSLAEMLTDREGIGAVMQLQHAMAAEAEAVRRACAKVIAAAGEQQAAVAYAEAADVMAEEAGTLQLRYLQTLQAVAGTGNSTIVFPLPIADMGLNQIMQASDQPLIDFSELLTS